MESPDDISYEQFCADFSALTGFPLAAYRPAQMERRARAFARRNGTLTLKAFMRLLAGQPALCQRYLEYLTINVTDFFRNPEQFEELAAHALLPLLKTRRELRIWCAGCANGAEAYTLSMLLVRLCPEARYQILATDIDAPSLHMAREGLFSERAMQNLPEALRRRYFTRAEDGRYRIDPVLQRAMHFTAHDLLRDLFPDDFDLIVCRNVVIYFTAEAKEALYLRLFEALRPGGYLMLGKTERILTAHRLGFLIPRPHLYQRPE
ncbi:MAG: CheR family methyltransferase [Armatimonadota bacterium]